MGTERGAQWVSGIKNKGFDTDWPDEEPLNQVTLDRVPTGATRPSQVIARLVWPDVRRARSAAR